MTQEMYDTLLHTGVRKPYSAHLIGPHGWWNHGFYGIYYNYDDNMTWKDAVAFATWKSDADNMCDKLNGAYLMGMSDAIVIMSSEDNKL
jgi:hypothetical protein